MQASETNEFGSQQQDRGFFGHGRGSAIASILKRPAFALSFTFLFLLILAVLLAPWISPHDPNQINLSSRLQGPNLTHWLGTDESGRDNLTRLLYGGRVSLVVGIVAMAVSIVFGTFLGAISGFFGGLVDNVAMRMTDGMLAIPVFFFLLIVLSVFGATLFNIVLVIGFTSWMGCARVVRGDILRSANLEFVVASKAMGAAPSRVLFVHLMPQAVPSVIVASTLGIAQAILLETTLSYLGLGIQPPQPSWGNMLSNAQAVIFTAPWMAIYPGFAILLTVLAFNALGEVIRELNEPKK